MRMRVRARARVRVRVRARARASTVALYAPRPTTDSLPWKLSWSILIRGRAAPALPATSAPTSEERVRSPAPAHTTSCSPLAPTFGYPYASFRVRLKVRVGLGLKG